MTLLIKIYIYIYAADTAWCIGFDFDSYLFMSGKPADTLVCLQRHAGSVLRASLLLVLSIQEMPGSHQETHFNQASLKTACRATWRFALAFEANRLRWNFKCLFFAVLLLPVC